MTAENGGTKQTTLLAGMAESINNSGFSGFFDECRQRALQLALDEDRQNGDITTMATIDPGRRGRGVVRAKEEGIVAGVEVARQVFHLAEPSLVVNVVRADGVRVSAGEIILEADGAIAPILFGERTVLNFMQRMSGIATKTARFVEAVSQTKARILDTRKTAPGLRYFDKDAVRIGGGLNHRFGLFDMILVKDNHIDASGGVEEAIGRAQQWCREAGRQVKIETEVRSLDELKKACPCRPDIVLLDNFTVAGLAEAVRWVKESGYGDIVLEASGNVGLHNVAEIAMTGVDYISVGELTHSVRALDLSMKIALT